MRNFDVHFHSLVGLAVSCIRKDFWVNAPGSDPAIIRVCFLLIFLFEINVFLNYYYPFCRFSCLNNFFSNDYFCWFSYFCNNFVIMQFYCFFFIVKRNGWRAIHQQMKHRKKLFMSKLICIWFYRILYILLLYKVLF